jgi:phage tail sheath protein FI
MSKCPDATKSDGSSSYYKDIINQTSKYVWWIDHPVQGVVSANITSLVDVAWGQATQNSKSFAVVTSVLDSSLGFAVSGDAPADNAIISSFSEFSNDEKHDISLILAGAASNTVINSLVSLAETRRDCLVFASPLMTDVVNTTGQAAKVVATRNTLTSSSYGFMDSSWKYQYDRYNDKYRWVPMNGDIAGLAARTDYTNDPWFSPAGFNRGTIKNVVKLSYSPSKTDRDTLYKNGINPVVSFPGQGTVLFGDKTLLSKPSAFDRINVRRLFIVLEKAIATAAKFQLFEFNDGFTRAQFKNLVEPFLRDVQGRRGVTDFKVVCDETNNTGEVIDRNEFVADIFIKPARSINFIQLNFIATRTGISFEETGA